MNQIVPNPTVSLPVAAQFSLVPPGRKPGQQRMNTWQSVRADVLGRIRSGEWAPGTLIPTEHELAQEMGCARATVNRALRELAESGILQRRRKVGTRVTARASRRTRLELPAIRDEIEALGATLNYRLTDYRVCPAPVAAQKALQIDAGTPVVQITTAYLADATPHCCEVIWLNPAALPEFGRDTFGCEPPHEWLARSVPVAQAQFSILAGMATAECSAVLAVPEGTPALTIERTNSLDRMPVSFARQFYPPCYRLDLAD
ncbi:MAG: GntR family transcriptional regulator [Paracoccus sp. (in: a-proteobacteria)]